jgi:hypothetical protein
MPHLPIPPAQCFGLDAFSPWERRARLSVGSGCPSSGGQRTAGGGSSRLLAHLVTSWRSSRPLKVLRQVRWRVRVSAFSAGISTGQASSRLAANAECSSTAGPTTKVEMPEVSTRVPSAGRWPGLGVARSVAPRSCHLLAQPRSPNHSVKETCLRQAPYVER